MERSTEDRPGTLASQRAGPVACHVWWATAVRSRLVDDLLDDHERQRAGRFLREGPRTKFIAARALAKRAVAERTGVAPEDVRILTSCPRCGADDHGKPRAEHPRGSTTLSISHSGDVVMVATSDGPDVGVDVERMAPDRWNPRLRRLVESTSSPEGIDSAATFFLVWTCKEAILKCTGEGLFADMRSVALRIDDGDGVDGRPRVRVVGGPWPPRRHMSVHVVPIAGPYASSVAIDSHREVALEIRKA